MFYNAAFLEHAKAYWKADYAKPEMMLFNVNGPCANRDPGHLDSPSFRGVRFANSPTWLCSVMGKSGLFTDYLIKMAQVISWFSHDPESGFTYWPDGPMEPPARVRSTRCTCTATAVSWATTPTGAVSSPTSSSTSACRSAARACRPAAVCSRHNMYDHEQNQSPHNPCIG